ILELVLGQLAAAEESHKTCRHHGTGERMAGAKERLSHYNEIRCKEVVNGNARARKAPQRLSCGPRHCYRESLDVSMFPMSLEPLILYCWIFIFISVWISASSIAV